MVAEEIVQRIKSEKSVSDSLRELGIRDGDALNYSAGRGPIRGTSGGGADKVIYAFFRDTQDKRGLLVGAVVEESVEVIDMVTFERRADGEWMIVEGHGGLGAYQAVREYAEKLLTTDRRTIEF